MLRAFYPNGERADLTDAQQERLDKIAELHGLSDPVTVHPDIGRSKTVLLRTPSGMVIGIEPDGYAHT